MKRKRVILCVLNWGLGHAARSVPVINSFLGQNQEVFIAGDGDALLFLQKEFPQLKSFELPSYDISYPENGNMALSMLLQSPKILSAIRKEKATLKKLVDEHHIDVVVSDNRFGCSHEKIRSVFITHQLNIRSSPGMRLIINNLNHRYIKKFSEVWVPDVEGNVNLSGELSHQHDLSNVYYIGPLSRFRKSERQVNCRYKYMVLLSGPEPQRSILEKEIVSALNEINERVLLVRGLVKNDIALPAGILQNITVHDLLAGKELEHAFNDSEIVICRSGYSGIMDLAALGKKAVLIPTPGQTEQEYLADFFEEKKIFLKAVQGTLNLKDIPGRMDSYSGISTGNDLIILKERIRAICSDKPVN